MRESNKARTDTHTFALICWAFFSSSAVIVCCYFCFIYGPIMSYTYKIQTLTYQTKQNWKPRTECDRDRREINCNSKNRALHRNFQLLLLLVFATVCVYVSVWVWRLLSSIATTTIVVHLAITEFLLFFTDSVELFLFSLFTSLLIS